MIRALRVPDYRDHIRSAIERIFRYTEDMDEAAFTRHELVQDAVIRNIELIGEASRNIERADPSFVARHPKIELRNASATRNALSHGYYKVDLETVWNTIEIDLLNLHEQIVAALRDSSGAPPWEEAGNPRVGGVQSSPPMTGRRKHEEGNPVTDVTVIVADWRNFSTAHGIERAEREADGVALIWSDGRRTRHHRFWLRDNCPCAQCYLALTREQVFEIVDAPENLVAAEAHAGEGGLDVVWSDGHRSRYETGWLRAHAGDEVSRRERAQSREKPVVWGGDYCVRSFACADLLADDATLLAWLSQLRSTGLTLVIGVPVEHEALLKPIARISHLRETNFGRVFDVKSKPQADSAAYTSVNLPPHTDLPTRELQPGVQFLHCLVNDATGGESVFVDGFAIGEAMRREHPAEFAKLATTPMAFWNRDSRTDYRWNAPILALDANGEIEEVRFANFLRGPIDAPESAMGGIYAALRLFQAMTRDARFFIERRLQPGDMWAFDNRRVLHARRAFDPESGARHLQGAYVDRDEIHSRWRVLAREQGAG